MTILTIIQESINVWKREREQYLLLVCYQVSYNLDVLFTIPRRKHLSEDNIDSSYRFKDGGKSDCG